MIKRFFDLFLSLVGIVFFSPVFLAVSLLVLTTKGPVFYRQVRIGQGGRPFKLIKFRTMYLGADRGSLITIGNRDNRVTRVGYFLRKYKLDELPQLLNVIGGSMSLVGPRPEVKRYVDLYNNEQLNVLCVKPGITDWASIEFRNENELLVEAIDPETFYINTIMPRKLELNLEYVKDHNIFVDIKVIWATFLKIIRE